ncbi:hypothetical protein [Anaeromyxobacter paludicola]|uniref:hypothetical protein n=1 Tax=Anaeromyxobacter paludicola TaxID=2918171 RepID=UPI0020C073AB|nr:hypothetical protein [Anaeromyxobacter paludicola]
MLTIWAGPVRAEPPSKKPAPKKVLRLEEMKVEGRIRKPQAMFLMPRANLSVGELDRSPSFVSKVARAAEKDPF